MNMELTTHTAKGVDKVTRYGWTVKDQPGDLRMVHKDLLVVDISYQREVTASKVTAITAAWSYLSCGALIIAERNGTLYVIDGGHRLAAAKRRSDITHLPCVVFQTASAEAEARGFLSVNTGRKPVNAMVKHKALLVAGDEAALVEPQAEAIPIAPVEVVRQALKELLESISECRMDQVTARFAKASVMARAVVDRYKDAT